jgi:tetratricopeptide (TPR) repeat protein
LNLFRLIKLSRELSRMEKKAKANPSPSTFVDLAQVYINLGWHAHTMRVAEEGLLLFPRSEELRKVHKFAGKSLLKERVQELRERITKAPTAKLYRELAQIYVDIGDQGALLATCQECLRRFPDDADTHLLLAAERIKSFYRTLSATEGKEAVQILLKVLEIDRANIKAHKQLAEVYFRIGAIRHAREHLAFLRERYPDDEEVKLLVREIGGDTEEGEDPERLFSSIERQGTLLNKSLGDVRKARNVAAEEAIEGIREGLNRLVELDGVKKAAYIRGSKALVKGDIKDGRDPFLKTVRVVAKASQRAARRMDLGNFSKSIVDGDFGHLCICNLGDVCAAVQCASGTRVEQIVVDLQELVAGSLYAAGRRKD